MPRDYTISLAAKGSAQRLFNPGTERVQPTKPTNGFKLEEFVRHAYHYIWNWRMPGLVDNAYAPTMRFPGPTNRELYGRGAYKAFLVSLMAMFPDFALQIDDLYWMGNDRDGYRTSVRWSLFGTHTGAGVYGAPTGRAISIWGLTQHVIHQGQIVEEWMVFNEFDLMQQLYHD